MADKIVGIAEQKTFVDTKGRRVFQFIEVFGKDKGKYLLHGAATVSVKSPDPRVPTRQMPFEFEFAPGTTLEQAFEVFDDEAKKELDKMQRAQAEQSRIVAAKMMPQILGPNGKPSMKG